jgi:integrase
MLRDKLRAKEKGVRHVPQRTTLGDLLDMLRDHHELAGTKSWPRIRQCAHHLAEHFGREARIVEIDYTALEAYVRARRRVAASATIRFELSVLSQAFKVGIMRGRVASAPPMPTVKVANTRTACFTDDELASLLDELPAPVKAVAEFAALTGWRLMECLNLRWDRVDLAERVVRLHPTETKSGRGRTLPYATSPRLVALLDRQRRERWRAERERGVAVTHVFHRNGRPIKSVIDAWQEACRRAGLEDRHFHDLRRYACQRFTKAGVAPVETMALMGHATQSMFVRYSIIDRPMLEKAVAKVARLDH